MLYAIVISTILCPYSKYAIEHIFFKFIKKDFFRKRKNLNNAPVAKLNLFMLYNLLCLVLAIPQIPNVVPASTLKSKTTT
ncbi:colicin E1 family microcin immunity protein [Shigella sonnei]|nr:colicin E1 family microcin immunity protein [Shigella sonnei]